MAVEFSRDKPWAAAICTICVKYFTDPVSLECGHNFCRSCITRCWEELHKSICCPRWCHYFLEGRKFEPNRELADFVEATKQRVEQVKEEAKEWANCGEHRKPLNLFCEDDQAAICEDCMKLEAHRNHCVVGVEISHQIDAYINVPREMESAFTIYSYNSGKMTDVWLKRVEAERKRTLAKFKHLRQCLDELENLRLARLVELEKEIIVQRDQHGEKIDCQINFLIQVEEDMADYYFNPREFLQDFGHGLPSYDEEQLENAILLPENAMLLPTDVKDKIQNFCDQKLFLEEVLNKFNDEIAALLKGGRMKRTRSEVLMEESGSRVDVILDQDTANHHLILSANGQKMYYVDDLIGPLLPKGPKRFEFTPCVLGRQAFSSGRHWWEVKVGGSGLGWAVGVTRESLKRDAPNRFWETEGIWVVGKTTVYPLPHRRLLAFSYPETTLLTLTRKPEKIRVCLDYPAGQVAFFNAETNESLFVFDSCSFLGEKVRPLFWMFGVSVTLSC